MDEEPAAARSDKFAIEPKAGGLYLQKKSSGLADLDSLCSDRGLRNTISPDKIR